MHHRSGVGHAGSHSADFAVGGQPAPLQHRSYLWLPLYSGLEVTCHLCHYINCRYFTFIFMCQMFILTHTFGYFYLNLFNLRAHLIMRNRFQINPDISETGFGFSGFLHLIGETETGFAKSSKPGREMVSLTKPKMAHVFTLNYLLSSSLKLRLKVTYST